MSDIMTYAHKAHITDHTYAPICGVVRYVGKGFITVSQSSTHYELHYLEPYLDTAKKITADPNPVIFKRGILHRWNRAIYVEDNLGTLTIHCGVRIETIGFEPRRSRDGMRVPYVAAASRPRWMAGRPVQLFIGQRDMSKKMDVEYIKERTSEMNFVVMWLGSTRSI